MERFSLSKQYKTGQFLKTALANFRLMLSDIKYSTINKNSKQSEFH